MNSLSHRSAAGQLAALVLCTTLVTLGCAGEAGSESAPAGDAAAAGGKCSSALVELEIGGWGTAMIDTPELQEQYGRFVEQCAYNFPLFAWEKKIGDCAVTSVTFAGSEPIPQVFNLSHTFEKLVDEAEVEAGGELAWQWSGDVFNCDTKGCAEDGLTQIELLRNDFNFADDIDTAMDKCPWTKVQARFELAEGK